MQNDWYDVTNNDRELHSKRLKHSFEHSKLQILEQPLLLMKRKSGLYFACWKQKIKNSHTTLKFTNNETNCETLTNTQPAQQFWCPILKLGTGYST